jgi:hypothetical protein
METKLEILICVITFISILIVYSGNSKTNIGKKIKDIGIGLCCTNFIINAPLVSNSSTIDNIFFYTGLLMFVFLMFELSKIVKKLAAMSS